MTRSRLLERFLVHCPASRRWRVLVPVLALAAFSTGCVSSHGFGGGLYSDPYGYDRSYRGASIRRDYRYVPSRTVIVQPWRVLRTHPRSRLAPVYRNRHDGHYRRDDRRHGDHRTARPASRPHRAVHRDVNQGAGRPHIDRRPHRNAERGDSRERTREELRRNRDRPRGETPAVARRDGRGRDAARDLSRARARREPVHERRDRRGRD